MEIHVKFCTCLGFRRYSGQKPDLHECLLQPYHVGQMAQDVGIVWFCLPCFAWGVGEWLLLTSLLLFFFFCFELLFLLWVENLNIIDRGLSILFFFLD